MIRRPLVANLAAVLTVAAFMPMPTDAGAQTRGRRPPPAAEGPSGAEAIAAAQPAITAAGYNCQVSNAVGKGTAVEGGAIFEIACATGPGYILRTSEPPTAANCFALAESARRALAENPDATPGVTCELPENNNLTTVLASYASSAGLTCQVDGGLWAGRTSDGKDRYEVGCNGTDGYWVEVAANGTVDAPVECLEVASAGGACTLTTPTEQLAGVRAMLQGAETPACDIQQVAFKGSNSNGRFYEVKCADASGFIFRNALTGGFQQAYACVDATQIAGGCTLTDVSGVIAAESQTRLQRVTALGFPCTVTEEAQIGQESGGRAREVYEFKCSDRPLGLVAFLPPSGDEGAMVMDCLSMRIRGSNCRFTSEDEIRAVMTNMFTAAGQTCAVTGYAAISEMEDEDGEFMEVKCEDGRGLLANFPADRERVVGRVLTCDQAATREYACVL